MTEIPEFSGGNPSLRGKLNRMVSETVRHSKIIGDSAFITVDHGAAGVTVRLNINAVIARIPKTLSEGDFVGWFRITGATVVSPNIYNYTMRLQTGGVLGNMADKEVEAPETGIITARNSVEIGNSAAGIQGNGANISNYPVGAMIRPAGGVRRVYSQMICNTEGQPTGQLQYWFSADNGMPEDCNVSTGGS